MSSNNRMKFQQGGSVGSGLYNLLNQALGTQFGEEEKLHPEMLKKGRELFAKHRLGGESMPIDELMKLFENLDPDGNRLWGPFNEGTLDERDMLIMTHGLQQKYFPENVQVMKDAGLIDEEGNAVFPEQGIQTLVRLAGEGGDTPELRTIRDYILNQEDVEKYIHSGNVQKDIGKKTSNIAQDLQTILKNVNPPEGYMKWNEKEKREDFIPVYGKSSEATDKEYSDWLKSFYMRGYSAPDDGTPDASINNLVKMVSELQELEGSKKKFTSKNTMYDIISRYLNQ
tara:strand:+ start:1741 stop:2592 length:852 start_codon:yes stop_codon:yes gene_type:complete